MQKSPQQRLSEALGLFPSVIKSGEPWTPTCQQVLDDANSALREIADGTLLSSAEVDDLTKAGHTLLYVSQVLDHQRLAGMDQNPMGWRDLLYSSANTVDAMMLRKRKS